VKLALAKYGSPDVEPLEAIEKLMNGNLRPYCERERLLQYTQPWRKQRLYNEECDVLYKNNLKSLTAVFDRYSGKENVPGEKPTICIDEIADMCERRGLVDKVFTAREVKLCYTRAMQTEVDEMSTDSHRKMALVEFLECIARIADTKDLTIYCDGYEESLEAQGGGRYVTRTTRAHPHLL
jgi:hypothetical protein